MTRVVRSLSLLSCLAIAVVVAACSESKAPPAGTVTSGALTGQRAPAPGDPACPRTGEWQPCSLVDRLVHAGLSFKATGDSARVSFLEVPGVRYRVALTDTMLAFFFKDSIALKKAMTKLDTIRMTPAAVSPTDTALPWPSLPNVIRSGNLLALYFAESPRQIERVRLAITAGAPAK